MSLIHTKRKILNKIIYGVAIALILITTPGCSIQPTPLDPQEIGNRAVNDFELLLSEEPRPLRPVTLDMAMEMALNHNLEHRIKIVEEALALGQLDLAIKQLLPNLTGTLSRNERSRDAGSVSEALSTGFTTEDHSTSLEKVYTSGNATLTWNLLDFGVSFVRAQQQADNLLIADERHRKVKLEIIRDVRHAYWQAVNAEAILPQVESSLQSARSTLEKSKKLEQELLQSPDEALGYQEDLLRQIQLLVQLQKELVQAKVRLAMLIAIRPTTPFTLDISCRNRLETPEIPFTTAQLEELAMVSRPELREEDYQQRISAREARVALLKILPGFETTLSSQYDDNRYLKHSAWGEIAYRLSYSLNDLFSAPARIHTAEARQQLAAVRRLAMSMTVLTQVNLALQDFYQAKNDFALAEEMVQLKTRQMSRETKAKLARGGASFALERRQVELLVATIQRDRSYASLQNAYGMILNSVGLEHLPAPTAVKGADLHALAEHVHGQHPPEENDEPRDPTYLQQRMDHILQFFGVPIAGPLVRHVSPTTWKVGDDQAREKTWQEGKTPGNIAKSATNHPRKKGRKKPGGQHGSPPDLQEKTTADGQGEEASAPRAKKGRKKPGRPLPAPKADKEQPPPPPNESPNHGTTKKWVLVNQ